MTAHRCAGGLKKKFDLRSGSQRHRHFVGFFNVPVLAPTRDQPFYTVIPTHHINDKANVSVIQSTHDPHDASSQNIFYLCTNDVPPCFAMLSRYNQCRNMQLLGASMNMNGVSYLSSSKLVHDVKSASDDRGFTHSIQGPSVGDWNEYKDKSESGRDNVFSIHCRFWPQVAKECSCVHGILVGHRRVIWRE